MTASVVNTYLLLARQETDGETHLAVSLATWNGEGSYENKHPLLAETTHGFNMTEAAFGLLGIEPVPGAPSLAYRLLTLIKVYGPNGMTPMTIEQFLEAFPQVSASEGFWASLKVDRERRARLAAARTQGAAVYGKPQQGSSAIPDRRAAKLARRAERLEAKRARRAKPEDLPPAPKPRRAASTVALNGDGTHTYETHDLLAAAVASQQGKTATFSSGLATTAKYVDKVTKAKKVHTGTKDLTGAVITDVARVWITLQHEGTTWYVKVLEPGATVTFTPNS